MCYNVATGWRWSVEENTYWFCSGFQMNGGLQQMSGEEGWRWGEGERRAVDVAVEESDCELLSPLSPIYVFQEVHPSLASPSCPLFSVFSSSFLPFPPPPSSTSNHFTFHLNTFKVLVSDLPASLMPFDFGSPSSSLSYSLGIAYQLANVFSSSRCTATVQLSG